MEEHVSSVAISLTVRSSGLIQGRTFEFRKFPVLAESGEVWCRLPRDTVHERFLQFRIPNFLCKHEIGRARPARSDESSPVEDQATHVNTNGHGNVDLYKTGRITRKHDDLLFFLHN